MFFINSPLEQFTIFETLLFLNNFSYFLLLVFLIIFYYVNFNSTVNSNWVGIVYFSLFDTVNNFLPVKFKQYLPAAFGIFMYILVSNLVGLVPYSYSVTCELVLTLTISLSILLGVTIIGFNSHGLHYFSYFLPSGTPLGLVPLLVLIELVSYVAKGLSLGIRLAGNIISGHLLLHIIASFVYKLVWIFAIIPFVILIMLMGLEFIIAFLQAYVFTILFTVYLRDAHELH